MLYISNPSHSLQTIMTDIKHYGSLSGFQVNEDKSEAMLLRGSSRPPWTSGYAFRWNVMSLPYLGVQITRRPTNLYQHNIRPLITNLESQLLTWRHFTLSFLGRANLLKMVVFPKLLYLLQSLPLHLRPADIKHIESLFHTFIWNGRRPRIGLSILQQHKTNGGINFPQIQLYNLAANLRIIGDWLTHSSNFADSHLEQQFIRGTSLTSFLHLAYSDLTPEIKANPLLMATWRTWTKTRQNLNLNPRHSLLLPLTQNPQFQRERSHTTFYNWRCGGINRVEALINKETRRPYTFNGFRLRHAIVGPHPFYYLQVCSYAYAVISHLSEADWKDPFLALTPAHQLRDKQITTYYSLLRKPLSYSSSGTGVAHWVSCLEGVTVSDILASLAAAAKFLPSAMYWEMTYKIVHRAYVSPHRGFLMGNSPSHACLKCGAPHTDLLHCLWSCPSIHLFWSRVTKFALTSLVPFCPNTREWCLFGRLPADTTRNNKTYSKLLFYISAAARKAVLQCWIETDPPSIRIFLNKLSFLFRMDWIEASLCKELRVRQFFTLWRGFITLLPAHIQQKLKSCFGLTTWYLEQQISGSPPIT